MSNVSWRIDALVERNMSFEDAAKLVELELLERIGDSLDALVNESKGILDSLDGLRMVVAQK